jgi:hypothetical protein
MHYSILVPKNFKIKEKIAKLCPLKVRATKWQLAYFWPSNGLFGKNLINMDLILVLPIIQINIDGQTNF